MTSPQSIESKFEIQTVNLTHKTKLEDVNLSVRHQQDLNLRTQRVIDEHAFESIAVTTWL